MPCLNKNLSSFSYYNALLKTVNIFEPNKKRLYSTRLNPALIPNDSSFDWSNNYSCSPLECLFNKSIEALILRIQSIEV